jgi:hypothetical protein
VAIQNATFVGARKMTKPHQEEHKHKRFYVFRHTGGDNIMYRTGEGGWTEDFRVAELWANEDFAFKKAGVLKKRHMSWATGLPADSKERTTNFVVGSVNVEVNPYYAMRVSK